MRKRARTPAYGGQLPLKSRSTAATQLRAVAQQSTRPLAKYMEDIRDCIKEPDHAKANAARKRLLGRLTGSPLPFERDLGKYLSTAYLSDEQFQRVAVSWSSFTNKGVN